MHVLHWLDEHLEAGLAAILLAGVVTLIACGVFMRYVVGESLSWGEELTLWIFVWFVWLATSYAFKKRKHVKIIVFKHFLPARGRAALDIVCDILIIGFLGVLIYECINLINMPFVAQQRSVVLGMPIPILYTSAPFGAALSILRVVQNLLHDLHEFAHPSAVEHTLAEDVLE